MFILWGGVIDARRQLNSHVVIRPKNKEHGLFGFCSETSSVIERPRVVRAGKTDAGILDELTINTYDVHINIVVIIIRVLYRDDLFSISIMGCLYYHYWDNNCE